MGNGKHIGIMTFFRVNNYGAVLQAYGLSTTLEKLGYDVEIIDYECKYLEKPYRFENLRNKGISAYLASLFGYFTRFPRNKKFRQFRNKYLKISSKQYNNEMLKNASYDIFLAGSDQIWNLNATNGDTGYLLEGISDQVIKCSYAASFGTSAVDDKWKDVIKRNLDTFSNISIREQEGVLVVNELMENEVARLMIDPVFLIKAEEWRKISCKPNVNKYILVYQQSITKVVVDIAKSIAKEKHLNLLFIPFPIGKIALGKYKTNYSPEEWLGLIDNAEYVITDSFHGVALSIILNKSFFVSLAGVSVKTGGRIKGLLNKFNLNSRYINKTDDIWDIKDIDYNTVNKILNSERENAIQYLQMMDKKNDC